MNDIFEVRGNIYNIKNFQSLYSSCKKKQIWKWNGHVQKSSDLELNSW